MVVIRLARFGRKKAPVYQLTVADKKARLGGKFIERVGGYNPQLKGDGRFVLNKDRYEFWLKQGAQPSPRVVKLISDFSPATSGAAS